MSWGLRKLVFVLLLVFFEIPYTYAVPKKDQEEKKKGNSDSKPAVNEGEKDKKKKKKKDNDSVEDKKEKKKKGKKNSDDNVTEFGTSDKKVDNKDSKSVGDKDTESAIVDETATEGKEGKKKKDKKDNKKNKNKNKNRSRSEDNEVDNKDSKSVGDKDTESAVVDETATEEKEGKKKKGKKDNKKNKNRSRSEDDEVEEKSASKSEKRKHKKGFKNKSSDDGEVQEPDEEVEIYNRSDYMAKLSVCLERFFGHDEKRSDNIRSDMKEGDRLVYDARYAQYDENGKNIPLNDVQFKRSMIVQIDLNDKFNSPLFHRGREITHFIVSALEKGALVGYGDSHFEHEYTVEEFRNQYVRPKDVTDGGADFDEDIANEKEYFTPHEMSILELGINWIYDKNSSSFSKDIISLCVIIPENYFKTGLRKEVVYIKYREFIKYLKTIKMSAVWVNDENEVGDISMAEILEISRYKCSIIRIGSYYNVIDNFETKENDKTLQYREGERFVKKFEASLDSI